MDHRGSCWGKIAAPELLALTNGRGRGSSGSPRLGSTGHRFTRWNAAPSGSRATSTFHACSSVAIVEPDGPWLVIFPLPLTWHRRLTLLLPFVPNSPSASSFNSHTARASYPQPGARFAGPLIGPRSRRSMDNSRGSSTPFEPSPNFAIATHRMHLRC